MFRPLKGLGVIGLTLAVALSLSACRESELGRPLSHDKGTYQGKADTPLDEATLKALRQRTTGQGHSGI
jgi:hypothetical protein